jgi:hypothetical protein
MGVVGVIVGTVGIAGTGLISGGAAGGTLSGTISGGEFPFGTSFAITSKSDRPIGPASSLAIS